MTVFCAKCDATDCDMRNGWCRCHFCERAFCNTCKEDHLMYKMNIGDICKDCWEKYKHHTLYEIVSFKKTWCDLCNKYIGLLPTRKNMHILRICKSCSNIEESDLVEIYDEEKYR